MSIWDDEPEAKKETKKETIALSNVDVISQEEQLARIKEINKNKQESKSRVTKLPAAPSSMQLPEIDFDQFFLWLRKLNPEKHLSLKGIIKNNQGEHFRKSHSEDYWKLFKLYFKETS